MKIEPVIDGLRETARASYLPTFGALILALALGEANAQTSSPIVGVPETFTVYSRMVDRDVTFKVDLDVPAGSGPFPAAILMHGCGGMVRDRAPQNWRQVFREWGFATLILESFSPRGWPANICMKEPEIGWQGQNDRTGEAFGAARLLRKLPVIRADGIVLVGFSHGGGTALWAAHKDDGYWRARGHAGQIERFNALIAIYPWCGIETHAFIAQPRPVETPLLIITGELDTVTPPILCRRYEDARGPISKGNVNFRVIAAAHHSFDTGLPMTTVPLCGGLPPKCGVPTTLGHSDLAFRQAQIDVAAFLRQKLNLTIP